ncbi:HD domain-containing protein [Sorangium sp. So ce1335]|uniref:HD domain-containing protein n=1 Tax=Sorangium sp. So ce1335 TaxID=3133335 RepID=UPI003F61224D
MTTPELMPPDAPLGLALPEPLWRTVCAAYGEPGRAYHDLVHVREVLCRVGEVARDVGWRRPREVFLAALFHDAVYEPGRHDSEARSAALAREAVSRWLPAEGLDEALIERLILLTARHGALGPADVDEEEALFLDCDMAILGSDPAAFDAYDRGIAAEYSAVPPELYAAGRRRFFERLLAAEHIFLSPYFRARLEGRARDNLRRKLGAAPGGAGS